MLMTRETGGILHNGTSRGRPRLCIPVPAFRNLRLQNPGRFRFENTAAEEKALLLTALETAVKIKRSRGRRGPSELSEKTVRKI